LFKLLSTFFKKNSTMHALVLYATNQPLDYQEVVILNSNKKNVLVDIKFSALNHRDLWITKGQYAGIKFPTILGSDGAGLFEGREVIINPSLAWGRRAAAQGNNYRILGMPDNGTFSGVALVPRTYVHPKPAHLDLKHAAALPLAGLTAWRCLFSRCKLRKGERVLISGVGGGVALFALQFAVAAGAEVWVTSGSDEKIAKAVAMGAKGGANYRTEGWHKLLQRDAGGFDVVIDSAAGDQFGLLVGLCNPGGRVGIYGGTLGKINSLSPQIVFWKQVSILGSTMGSNRDFTQMLAFVGKHEIVPVVDKVFRLEAGNEALAYMESGAQFGKIVLEH
jgi:zinc-binding alcohol dehydrogenase/oxidoreductase